MVSVPRDPILYAGYTYGYRPGGRVCTEMEGLADAFVDGYRMSFARRTLGSVPSSHIRVALLSRTPAQYRDSHAEHEDEKGWKAYGGDALDRAGRWCK